MSSVFGISSILVIFETVGNLPDMIIKLKIYVNDATRNSIPPLSMHAGMLSDLNGNLPIASQKAVCKSVASQREKKRWSNCVPSKKKTMCEFRPKCWVNCVP